MAFAARAARIAVKVGPALALGELSQPLAVLRALGPAPQGAVAQADAAQWAEVALQRAPGALALAEARLAQSSFLAGHAATLADVAVLHAVGAALAAAPPATVPAALRWADQLAHEPGLDVVGAAAADELAGPLAAAFKAAAAARRPLPADLFAGASVAARAAVPAAAAAAAAPEPKGAKADAKQAEPKAAKVGASSGAPGGAAATGEGADPIAECDLRVGLIVKAWKHPESDKLWCESIDVGDATGPREIASGLQQYFTLEQMAPRRCVVVANLKPRALAKFMSNGMVLCATSPDGKGVAFVTPPEGAKVGERVTFAGFEGPAAQPSRMDKKKIFEAAAPGLVVGEGGVCTYKGTPFMTSAGACTVDAAVAPKGSAIK